jgi:glutathione S-transferase
MTSNMAGVWFVISLALVEYFYFLMMVGAARGKTKIAAPAVTGHPDFERAYRVQMNTLEQLIMFIPAILCFARFVSERWAVIFGLVFIVGRMVYSIGYRKAPEKRGWGFLISTLPLLILLVGGLIYAGLEAYRAGI